MTWTPVNFGDYEGDTLPQIVLDDPDWFFQTMEEKKFRGSLKKEAEEVREKATRVKIIGSHKKKSLRVHYCVEFPCSVCVINLAHYSRGSEWRGYFLKYFDLSAFRGKRRANRILKALKENIFGDKEIVLTKEQCEEFFDRDARFYVESKKKQGFFR